MSSLTSINSSRRLPFIANCEQFPDVAVGLAPVDEVSAEGKIDLSIDWTVRQAAVVDTGSFDARKNDIKLLLSDSEAVVLMRYWLGPLVKVESEAVVDKDGRERTHGTLRSPRYTQKMGEQFRCSDSVS